MVLSSGRRLVYHAGVTGDGTAGTRDAAPARVVAGELAEVVAADVQRRRLVPRAVVVGLLAGLVAVAFRRALAAGDVGRAMLFAWGRTLGAFGPLVAVVCGASGAAVAVVLVRVAAPEASGSGIPHLKGVLHGLRPMRAVRILLVKFAGGVVGIASGLALGREGPTIQMGGAVGQLVGGWLRATPRERQTLVAAGAGAGLAAAFNAPLAGLVFVLEELQRDFSPPMFTTALVASVVADVVARSLSGQLPVFHVTTAAIPPLGSLPTAVVVGALAGLLGVAFNRALVATLEAFDRLRAWPGWLTGGAVGVAVGLVGWRLPAVIGSGSDLVAATLAGGLAPPLLAITFVARFALTMVSYGCGAPGGIFAPLLVLGAQLGFAVGLASQALGTAWTATPETFAVVGMAAYFAAIVRAPLTGIVLIVEMTGNYALVLPLLVACLVAYGGADLLGDRPIYEALLERDLLRVVDAPVPVAAGADVASAPGR